MVGKLAAASAALSVLSTAAAIDLSPNAKTVALNFQKRNAQDVAPTSTHFRKRRLAKRSGTVSEDLTWGDLLYYINITMGTPGQSAAVWLDTGSSDLWLPDTGSNICDGEYGCSNNGGFNPSQSSSYTTVAEGQFDIAYASGDELVGDYGQDKLSMNNAEIDQMIFGVVRKGQSSSPISGIMGIGYTLGESIASQSPNGQTYPNIVDKLYSTGLINSRSYSLYLNDLDNGHGTILFGGVDTDKYDGTLGIVDVQVNEETGNFDTFTVVLSGLSFTAGGDSNDISLGDSGIPVILDSGTTLTYLPDDIAQAIYTGLGIRYSNTYGAFLPCNADTSNMFFTFTFGGDQGVPIQVNLGQWLLPEDPEYELPSINGAASCSFGLLPSGTVAQGGGDILFGDTFLRSAYVVYDLDNNQIGLAQTKFDVSDSSIKNIGESGASTNTIPGATTVNNQASVAQTISQVAEPTGFGGGSGDGSQASATDTVVAGAGPTFKGLPDGGLTTGTTVAGQGAATSSSAASAMRAPPLEFSGMVTLGIASIFAMVSGSIFLAAA